MELVSSLAGGEWLVAFSLANTKFKYLAKFWRDRNFFPSRAEGSTGRRVVLLSSLISHDPPPVLVSAGTDKESRMRREVINEIIRTEQDYIHDLEVVIRVITSS
jgi:hypothetical protein